jgi:glycine/D-amino acid oxidase-like deaminating enzyme
MAHPDVIVIGAGVVGLSVAIAAQARGMTVTVLDREGPAAGASAGNAGAFAFTDILPLASPGILEKGAEMAARPTRAAVGSACLRVQDRSLDVPLLARLLARSGCKVHDRADRVDGPFQSRA